MWIVVHLILQWYAILFALLLCRRRFELNTNNTHFHRINNHFTPIKRVSG